jgi:hypothetical protein
VARMAKNQVFEMLLFARASVLLHWESEEDVFGRMREEGLADLFSLIMKGEDPREVVNRHFYTEVSQRKLSSQFTEDWSL